MAKGPTIKRLLFALALSISIAALVVLPRLWKADGTEVTHHNVLLITLDTTRADHLGCYGYGLDTSPNIDALADDAVRFDLAISTSALTPVSHASILTGLNPDRHGLRVFYGQAGNFLSDSHPTLATILKSHGWQTGAFISAYPASERFGLHWGFDTFETEVADWVMKRDPRRGRLPRDGWWLRQRSSSAQRRADAVADQALEWLERVQRPFLLWVHFFDPHDTSLVPPGDITERFGVYRGGANAVKAVYDPEIFFMDVHVGRILDHLRTTGEYDNTLIAVIADHGQGLGDHHWFPHRLLYQEQIRLPLIVRLPRGERGLVVSDVVRSIDVLPTILEALELEPPRPVQGLSLAALMEGKQEQPRLGYAEALNTLDVHAPRGLPPHQKDLLFCAMDRTWKLIYHKNVPENTELYHLPSDPKELHNVAAEQPEQAARLIAALEESGLMNVQISEPTAPMDPETLEKLRSLGYVDN